MPAPADVHINQAMTDFSLVYRAADHYASEMMPPISTDKWSDSYFKRTLKSLITPVDDLIGANSEPSEVDFDVENASYTCRDRGLLAYISHKEMKNADDVLELQNARIADVLNRMSLNREIRVADLLNTITNFAAANRIQATADWSSETNANIVKDIQDARRAIRAGGSAQTEIRAIITSDLWDEAARHPQLLGLLGVNAEGLVSADAFKKFFRIDQLFITEAEKNTADRGATTPTVARVWDTDKMVIVRVPKGQASKDSMMFGGIWTVRMGGVANVDWVDNGKLPDTVVVEWNEPKRGGAEGSIGYKAARAEIESILQPDMGAVIHTA